MFMHLVFPSAEGKIWGKTLMRNGEWRSVQGQTLGVCKLPFTGTVALT